MGMTFREIIESAEVRLHQAGVDSPRADAEWLAAHVTGSTRTSVILHLRDAMTPDQVSRFEALLTGRARRVPLQHLVGTAAFLVHELRVTEDVLTPRPETEQLALRCIDILRHHGDPRPKVLDWGTGSGCLAIAIAAAIPDARVTAIDVSEAALAIAQENAGTNGVATRIEFHRGDGFAALPPTSATFDLVVSNPPYIPTGDISDLQPEVRDHDPRLALDGGNDGLNAYRELASHGKTWLNSEGFMALEFGDGQAESLRGLFLANNWIVKSVEKDLSERERVLIVHPPRGYGRSSR
jgi:release factor glutamine methyltransferase